MPAPTRDLYRTVCAVAVEAPMPDSTKELLNAHHAAVLRELNQVHANISASLSDLREDFGGIREKMDEHTANDNERFSEIRNDIGVLKWAYGAAGVLLLAVLAYLKLL